MGRGSQDAFPSRWRLNMANEPASTQNRALAPALQAIAVDDNKVIAPLSILCLPLQFIKCYNVLLF